MRLNELFEIYIEDVDLIQHDTSLDGMRYRYNSLIRNVFGEKELEDIDFKDIKGFRRRWLKENIGQEKIRFLVFLISMVLFSC